MPIERARLDRMIALMDAWLQRRDREIAEGTYYDDDDEDEPPCDPLDAPPQPFSDLPPQKFMASPIKSYGHLNLTSQFQSRLCKERTMSDDAHADRNAKLKAAMSQRETHLNKDGGKGEVPCRPSIQRNGTKVPGRACRSSYRQEELTCHSNSRGEPL